MEETSYSGAELAARARVGPELVGRLVELGILRAGDGEAPYGLGDVRRVRLVAACAQAGLSLEGIGAAITDGRLSLAFLDLMSIAGPAAAPGRPMPSSATSRRCRWSWSSGSTRRRGWGGRSPTTRSTRWTGTCWAAPSWGGCWGWTTGC